MVPWGGDQMSMLFYLYLSPRVASIVLVCMTLIRLLDTFAVWLKAKEYRIG